MIAESLEEIEYGVVILTRSNHSAPWVNFEAVAMAKSLGKAPVATVLVDVSRADIIGPLSQFQDTILTNCDDTKKLVKDMAKAAGSKAPEATIDVLFESKWPELEAALAAAGDFGELATERSQQNILEEVLEIVRGIARDQRRGRPSAALPVVDFIPSEGKEIPYFFGRSDSRGRLMYDDANLTPLQVYLINRQFSRVEVQARRRERR